MTLINYTNISSKKEKIETRYFILGVSLLEISPVAFVLNGIPNQKQRISKKQGNSICNEMHVCMVGSVTVWLWYWRAFILYLTVARTPEFSYICTKRKVSCSKCKYGKMKIMIMIWKMVFLVWDTKILITTIMIWKMSTVLHYTSLKEL